MTRSRQKKRIAKFMKNKKNNPKEKQEFKKCPKCGAVGNWLIGDLCVKCEFIYSTSEKKQEFKRCPKCSAVGNFFIGDLCVKCDREKNKNDVSSKKI